MDEKVNALIANKANQFTEDDRTWLSTLTEDQLKKFDAPAETPVTPAAAAPAPAAVAPVVNADTNKAVLDALAKLPETINNAVDAKLALNSRQPVIDALSAESCKCPISVDTLKAMKDDELDAMRKQYLPVMSLPGQYGGVASGEFSANAESDAPEGMEPVFTKNAEDDDK